MPYNSNKETIFLLLLLISYIPLINANASRRLALMGKRPLYLEVIVYKRYMLAKRLYIFNLRSIPI